jgi:phage protein D
MDGNLLKSNAPVFLVDGERQGRLSTALVRLEIEEGVYGMKRLSARFTAWGREREQDTDEVELYLDGRVFDFGKRLEVTLGSADEARTVFKGAISAIEANYREGCEPEAVIFAEDKLMELRLSHRFKTYENVTDGDIARQIANEHGLRPDVAADGPTHDVVQQWNVSDLAFLRERARLIQAEVWVDDTTLSFKTRDQRAGSEVKLVQGRDLLRLEARADLAHQRTSATVSGYDVGERDAIDKSADIAAIRSEAGTGRSGPAVLREAFGAYATLRTREVPLKPDAAEMFAKAEMRRRARAFVRITGLTRGTPDLMVGSKAILERVAAPFAGGGYYVTRVMHTYDLVDGHRTLFAAERPIVAEP